MILQNALRMGVSRALGSAEPIALGIIYSKTLGDNLADWTIVNPTPAVSFTQSGSDVIFTGTGGTGGSGASDLFQDMLLLNTTDHAFTRLPEWKVRVRLTTGTINTATSFGIGLGIMSSNSFEERDSLHRIGMDSTFVGQVNVYYGDTDSTGIANQSQPGGTHALSSSTTYWFEFEQSDLTFTSRAFQSDGSTLIFEESNTDSPPGGTETKVHHNTGQFTLSQFGGTTTVHEVEISSNSLKNNKASFMGDSILYGGKASALSERWVSEYMASIGGTSVIMGGWADRMVDMETRKDEVKALNPTNIFIAGGSNDIKATTWGTTGEAALDTMITFFQANTSATIFLVTATARNDVNVTQVKTDMDTKGFTVLDLFTVTKQAANSNLLGPFNSGDGVHLNDAGHGACSAEAITEIPL